MFCKTSHWADSLYYQWKAIKIIFSFYVLLTKNFKNSKWFNICNFAGWMSLVGRGVLHTRSSSTIWKVIFLLEIWSAVKTLCGTELLHSKNSGISNMSLKKFQGYNLSILNKIGKLGTLEFLILIKIWSLTIPSQSCRHRKWVQHFFFPSFHSVSYESELENILNWFK